MLLQQQDAGVKPPDGSASPKTMRKPGALSGANVGAAATGGGTSEQEAQRCPRCDSLNTKFCYYNNYSLTQPRHFCKNCRRYWTKGGALRNVPVGGGCRKNKRLKHRDASCLAALADVDASGPSGMLPSISIPGFGHASSLIQELANEGAHRLAFSRLSANMQMLDKRFITNSDQHHQHVAPSTTQDFFAIGGSPCAPFDSNIPQSFLFHPHHTSDQLTPSFLDSINTPPSSIPTLDHLPSFTAGAPITTMRQVNAPSMDAAQLSVIHHMPINGIQGGHEEQQQANCGGRSFNNQEESANMSLRGSKGKPIISSLSADWEQQGPTTNAVNADNRFFTPPAANDNGLWSVSWPEMHAALAGSAGAILH